MIDKPFKLFALAIFLAVILIWLFGCSSIKESTNTTVTTRDSTITPSVVHDSILVHDDALKQWLYDELNRLNWENDSLRGLPRDTVKLKPSPFKHIWQAFKVTEKNDSIFVTFKYDNGDGMFTFKEIPAKIKIIIHDTKVDTTKEYQPPWYVKIWQGFKDVILIGLVILMGAMLVLTKLKVL